MVRQLCITEFYKPLHLPIQLKIFRKINKKIVFYLKEKYSVLLKQHQHNKAFAYQMRLTDFYPTIIFEKYYGQQKITKFFYSQKSI